MLPFLLPWPRLALLIRSIRESPLGRRDVAVGERRTAPGARASTAAAPRRIVELSRQTLPLILAVALLEIACQQPVSAQPAHQRVGPSYLYPTAATPGAVNPDVTQANISDTICKSGWTDTIRPPTSLTDALKKQQLAASKFKDKDPTHYEEDHFIALELGGHPRDPKNLWPEMWGTPGTPLTSDGPFPPHLVGAKTKDQVETALNKAVCDGTLTLQDSQDIIVTDWFKYYRESVLK